MTTIDDATLIQLARDRPEPLLPVLNRTGSYRPLIGVLAILPCLVALERNGLDDVGALWTMHALEGSGAAAGDAFVWQPPLLTWINELLLHATPLPKMIAPLIVPVLATMAVVWWSFRLFSTEDDERLGFWTALWLAFQGVLVLLATSTSPTVLVLLLALIVFDGWQRHFDDSESTVSLWLLVSGGAWGLAILAGGSIGLTILAVLLCEQLVREAVERRHPNRAKRARMRRQQRVRWGFSLLVAALVAVSVAGWWTVRSAVAGGSDFWSVWWNGYDVAVLSLLGLNAGEWDFTDRVWKMIVNIGPLLPLATVGGVRLAADMVRPADRNGGATATGQDNRHMLLPWLAVGMIAYLGSPAMASRGDYLTLQEAFLLVPLASCAALAIFAILQREVSLFVVVGTVGSSAVVFAVLHSYEAGRIRETAPAWWPILFAIVLSVAIGIAALVWSRDREPRTRIALLSLLGAQFALVAIAGWNRAETESLDERGLEVFREELNEKPADAVILVADHHPPARMRYAIRSLYPDAQWLRTRSWAAVTTARAKAETAGSGRTLIVDWLAPSHQTGSVDLGDAELKPAARSRFYRGRELRAFFIVRETL